MKVLNLEEISNEKIINFIITMDNFFHPPISEQICLDEYIVKLKDNGYIFGQIDQCDNIISLVCFYANDFIDNKAFISYLAIREDYQRRGFAKKIILEVLLQCAKNEMKKCRVCTWLENKEALNLYKKIGFNEVGIKEERGRVSVYLEKNITYFSLISNFYKSKYKSI
ncbi:GNAT family N-acetyltransferase [Acinetobacter schindleri]|uniref:GNAT family N-acetyltransferase n=1 Tax=Acinetobacter schindleri TaxID=108981 RepID=UPI003F57CD17